MEKDQNLYYACSIEKTLNSLDTDLNGLSDSEASKRLSEHGSNKLQEGKKRTLFGMLLEQFKNVMVIILIIAAVISGFLDELTDTFIIMAIVIINAVLGVVQESKAEKALEALKQLSAPNAKIKRNGMVSIIKAEEIVPGDIVILEAGDYVPADMRLLESANLKIEESSLTGESEPVMKTTGTIEKTGLVIGDRTNMAYSGSIVTYGRGTGIVTGTGMNTEVGKIAKFISSNEKEATPLQKKLKELGKYLSIAVVIIAAVIFATGVLQGREYLDMFLVAVSLAVAAIPEGMPAIVTIVLAIGVQKMSKRNAIIRKLPAVETLGSTQVICSDKTGTLTQNKMTVMELFCSGKNISSEKASASDENMKAIINIMTLCNDTKLSISNNSIDTIGDPTETALVEFAYGKGINKNILEEEISRIAEIPFDSDRKMMSTINRYNRKNRVFTKGAPDILLDRCSSILIDGKQSALDNTNRELVNTAYGKMADKALRVLAVAYRDMEEIPKKLDSQNIENKLVFAGLIGMIDPPRPEVKDAVQTCRSAGIIPVMITGDHRDTAAAIAKKLNMIDDERQVLTGAELDKISDEDFVEGVRKYSVYARVSPEHKVRIVKAWRKLGKVVAMTGDGVNDAPALKSSDIGVGMGITGTDVSKGVSDMVLSDDNFATIVVAVKEGRKIYNNIRKAIQFLLSANMGEVMTLFLATMLNWTVLFPIHILWINLVTDAFPALALGVDKAESDIMKQKPRRANSSIFSDGVGVNILYQGLIESAITLATYFIGLKAYGEGVAITMAFVTLGLIQLAHSFNVRSNTKSIFKIGLFSNRYLISAVLISAFLQVIVVILPGLNDIFKVEALNLKQWVIVMISSLIIIPAVEFVKLVKNK